MIKITNTAKLPLEVTRGTYEQRIHSALKANESLFNKLAKEFYRPTISVDTFTRHLDSILQPNKISYKIRNSNLYNFLGAVSTNLNSYYNNTEINRFHIFIPINDYDNSISINDINTLMHETLHFFIGLFSTKNTARSGNFFELGLKEKTEAFYSKYIYTTKHSPQELRESLLPNFLETLTGEERINFLQSTRYSLKEEMHCFLDGSTYEYKIKNMYRKFFENPKYESTGSRYRFPEKIAIVEEELAKALKEERENLAKSRNL